MYKTSKTLPNIIVLTVYLDTARGRFIRKEDAIVGCSDSGENCEEQLDTKKGARSIGRVFYNII